MDGRKVDELARLLGHVDQRVRLEAQYELADRAKADPGVGVVRAGRGTNAKISVVRRVAANGARVVH